LLLLYFVLRPSQKENATSKWSWRPAFLKRQQLSEFHRHQTGFSNTCYRPFVPCPLINFREARQRIQDKSGTPVPPASQYGGWNTFVRLFQAKNYFQHKWPSRSPEKSLGHFVFIFSSTIKTEFHYFPRKESILLYDKFVIRFLGSSTEQLLRLLRKPKKFSNVPGCISKKFCRSSRPQRRIALDSFAEHDTTGLWESSSSVYESYFLKDFDS
jgi:hypothetical protein